MDALGSAATPFLFVLDYSLREPLIMPLEAVSGRTGSSDGRPAYRKMFVHARRSEAGGACRASLPGMEIASARHVPQAPCGPRRPAGITQRVPVSAEYYRRGFEIVQQAQRAGDSYLVNLTFPTRIELEGTLSDIFDHAEAAYRLLVPDRFVVFSPEPFVRITSDGKISTYPMKGTVSMPADVDDDARSRAAEALGTDEKEAAEHATVVDLLRNDIGSVACEVSVPRYRYIDVLSFPDRLLLAASSTVCGRLDSGWRSRLGSIFRSMLPAGSVTGAPKRSTCDIISRAEGYDRGFYSGVFGCFDGERVESGVMIRFIERDERGYCFKSGGGITIYSEWEREYEELIRKVAIPGRGSPSVAWRRGTG